MGVDPRSLTGSTEQPRRSRRNHWMNQVAIHAQMRPDEVAIRFDGVDTTWRQLHERSDRLADALFRRGVSEGDRVLILMLNNTEYLESVLAINALGAIAVPVNFRLADNEICYIAEDSGAKGVITDSTLAPLAAAVCRRIPRLGLSVTRGEEYEALVAEHGASHPPIDVAEDSAALIMYTSGTTGHPKGAVLSHVNLHAQALTAIHGLRTTVDTVHFCAVPLFHIAGLGGIAPNLVLGTKTVIQPLGAFNATDTLDAWERERATSVFLVPAQWQMICADPSIRERDLALEVISWGAAPASDAVLRAMAETFPAALIVAAFGQTEMSPVTCLMNGADAIRKIGSVGKVIRTIAARVVDEEMNDVAVGEVGEIVYRGPTLTAGYWNNPQATAEAFAGGWFHSGDLVRVDEEGFVYVVDRKKDMIISGGENVYCAEIENVLFEHERILEAAVVGRSDDKWGEVPVAIVVADTPLTLAELEPFLNERLARFKHPKHLVLVESLPRNASGKVIKAQLRRDYA